MKDENDQVTGELIPQGALPPVVTTDRHNTPEARKAFNAAFAAAQGGFQPIVKNRTVNITPKDSRPYSFKFADLQEIHAKTRPSLAENGLSTTAQMIPGEDGVSLALVLAHADGFERVSEVFVTYGSEIKQFGGKLSFMRRYMLQNLLDVAADDDLDESDANGVGTGEVGQFDNAPAPAPRPARKSASRPPAAPAPSGPPDDEPPLEGSTTKPNAPAQAQAPADPPADPPAAAPVQQQAGQWVGAAEDDGELAEIGERNFLIKRAKTRGADLRGVLDNLGLSFLNAGTLENLTKAQFRAIKEKV